MSYFLLFTFFSSFPKSLYQREQMEILPPEAFPDLAAIFESVDGWSKEGCSDLIKGWCSLTPSFHKYVSSDFYVSDTRYTEMGNTADPALKSLEVLWALKQGGVLWTGRMGSKWAGVSSHVMGSGPLREQNFILPLLSLDRMHLAKTVTALRT